MAATWRADHPKPCEAVPCDAAAAVRQARVTRTCCFSAAPAPRRHAKYGAAIKELTRRALAAGRLNPDVTVADVMALTWAVRGLVEAVPETGVGSWQRFLDIHLADMRSPSSRE